MDEYIVKCLIRDMDDFIAGVPMMGNKVPDSQMAFLFAAEEKYKYLKEICSNINQVEYAFIRALSSKISTSMHLYDIVTSPEVITYAEFKYKIIRSSNLKAYSILLERELFTFLPSYEEYPHEIALRLESLMAKFRKVLIILESDDTVIKSRIDIHEKRLLEVVPRALNEKYALIASLKKFQTLEEFKNFLCGVREASNNENFSIFQHFKFSKTELQNEYETPTVTSDQAKQIIGVNMKINNTRQQNQMFKNKKVGEQNYENAIDSICNLKDVAWFQAENKKKLKKKNQIKNEIGHIDINEFEENFKEILLEIISKSNKLKADEKRIRNERHKEIINDSFDKINSFLQNEQKCNRKSGKLGENRQKYESNMQENIIDNIFKQVKFLSEVENENNTVQRKSSLYAAKMMDEKCRNKIKFNMGKCSTKLQATLTDLFDIKEFISIKVSPQKDKKKNRNKDTREYIKFDELDKTVQDLIEEIILEAKVSYKINNINNYKIIKESCEEVKSIQNDVNNRNVQYVSELEYSSLNVPTQEKLLRDFVQIENSTHQENNSFIALSLNPFFKNKHMLKLIELTLVIYMWMTLNEFKTRRSLQRQQERPGFDYQEMYRGKVKIRTPTSEIIIYQAQII